MGLILKEDNMDIGKDVTQFIYIAWMLRRASFSTSTISCIASSLYGVYYIPLLIFHLRLSFFKCSRTFNIATSI
jgi:hypothetical protein